ncbi:MAG: hypothetical protein JWO88_3594 [Frankiales bacterium]|nr:hypothetical protein [Frankiales bacterium]
MRDLTSVRAFTLSELAALAVGGGTHGRWKSPMFDRTLRDIHADVDRGKLALESTCVSGGAASSTVSRAAAVGWLRSRGATLPAALAAPATLEEARDQAPGSRTSWPRSGLRRARPRSSG